MISTEPLCTDPACLAKNPGPHGHLSMPDRQVTGEPVNDAIARMQAQQRAALESQRMFEAIFDHKPLVDTRTPADIRNGVRLQ